MFTYVGIGSCPHAETVAELTDEWDQMIPMFLRDTHRKSNLIHYDPAFERRQDFLKEYFESKGLVKTGELEWESDMFKVTLYSKRIYHPEDDGILSELVEKAITDNTKLVVQEFTGYELTPTLKAIYATCSDPAAFKRNVLMDITYGTECHCMTDMVKYKPLYTKRGHFANFLLYDEEEAISHIGDSPEINELIKGVFVKKYLAIVNQQVDYRRRMAGDTVLFPNAEYGNTSTPDEIMMYLQSKLKPILDIFDRLGMMTPKKWGQIWNLFEHYKAFNMYDWNTSVAKIAS